LEVGPTRLNLVGPTLHDMSVSCPAGLAHCAKNDTIPYDKIDEVVSLFLNKCHDPISKFRSYVVGGLAYIAKYGRLRSHDKIRDLVKIMLDKTSDSEEAVRVNAVACLCSLAETKVVPSDLVPTIIPVMMKKVDDRDVLVRYKSVTIIAHLAVFDSVQHDDRVEVVVLMIAKAEDEDIKVLFKRN